MKQVVQNYKTGKVEVIEGEPPRVTGNTVIVQNLASLLSLGTERSMIELGKKSLLGKARARPDLVKRFMEKAKQEGLIKTFQEALGRLDNPVPLGYSSAGIVKEVGINCHRFSPGDRVACIGAGYASHAEYVRVPENLCARIPNNVSFEEASFGMLGIIALHGVRCAKLTFGEAVGVIGLGLLGLLTVQILKAYGLRVICSDIDENKIEIAKRLGADLAVRPDEFKKACEVFTDGYGVDGVILTVATSSDEPVNTGVDVCKFGGRIVCVGVADIHPNRNELWHKEVEIIVSKAGGPGSLDPVYENKGIDYPFGYVRWTQNRNLEEFLRLIAIKRVDVEPLITHRFRIDEAERVYSDIMAGRGGPYIGVVFQYDGNWKEIGTRKAEEEEKSYPNATSSGFPRLGIKNVQKPIRVGVIGAGLFGKALLLPALKKTEGIELATISTSSSANLHHIFQKYGFKRETTDYNDILSDPNIDAVVILTPHRLHSRMVIDSLKAGKHVFVEKPLCINEAELNEIIGVYNETNDQSKWQTGTLFLMVGYNRRFSPHAAKMKEIIKNRQDPMVAHYMVNPGYVSPEHWVHSEEEGGSRVIGEICHFVDFMQFLTGSPPEKIYAERVSGNNRSTVNNDNVVVTLKFEDGSIGSITYSASGNRAFSREQVTVGCEGLTIFLKDFKELKWYKDGKAKSFKTLNQEIGYKEELAHFVGVLKGEKTPEITPKDIFLSTKAVFAIDKALSTGRPVAIFKDLQRASQ